MIFKELVRKNRSYRRYDEQYQIDTSQILEWIDLVRYTASARNAQPLKFFISVESSTNLLIFEHISWAGYLENGRPVSGERPAAYIVLCNDSDIASQSSHDQGIAAQTILLAAVNDGFGGCIFTSVKRESLQNALKLEKNIEPQMVIAIGKPIEQIVITEVKDRSIRYYRDQEGTHFVPKRPLKEIIIN